MKMFASLLLMLVLATAAWGQSGTGTDHDDFNLDKNGLALKGYDPVSYYTGSPQQGREELTLNNDGTRNRFISRDHMARFKADPDKFTPAYGGWCAWAMLDGDKVDIDPKSFKIIDGRNYFIYNGFWGDTLKKWNARVEKETEPALLIKADANWAQIAN